MPRLNTTKHGPKRIQRSRTLKRLLEEREMCLRDIAIGCGASDSTVNSYALGYVHGPDSKVTQYVTELFGLEFVRELDAILI